jgi:hypothetical protein
VISFDPNVAFRNLNVLFLVPDGVDRVALAPDYSLDDSLRRILRADQTNDLTSLHLEPSSFVLKEEDFLSAG